MTDIPPPLDRDLRALLDQAIDTAPPSAAVKASLRARIASTIGGGAGGAGAGGLAGHGSSGLGAKATIIGIGGAATVSAVWLTTISPTSPPPKHPVVAPAVARAVAPTHEAELQPDPPASQSPSAPLAEATPPASPVVPPARRSARLTASTTHRSPPPAPRPPLVMDTVDTVPTSTSTSTPTPLAADVASPPMKPSPGLSVAAKTSAPDLRARERALLEDARQALARHAPGRALARLRDHGTEFPDGTLAEEREALAVQALVASGDRRAARARATNFRDHYSDSIFLDLVDELVPTSNPNVSSEAP